MSEGWAIFVVGALVAIVQLLLCGILGWFAFELRGLREALGYRVHVYDCNRRMQDLEGKVKKLAGE